MLCNQLLRSFLYRVQCKFALSSINDDTEFIFYRGLFCEFLSRGLCFGGACSTPQTPPGHVSAQSIAASYDKNCHGKSWHCVCLSLSELSLLLIGTNIDEVDNATHTYTALGTYTITCVAINAIGNTTIQYVVVVQIPVSPDFVLNSSAPVIFSTGNNTGKQNTQHTCGFKHWNKTVAEQWCHRHFVARCFTAVLLVVHNLPWIILSWLTATNGTRKTQYSCRREAE